MAMTTSSTTPSRRGADACGLVEWYRMIGSFGCGRLRSPEMQRALNASVRLHILHDGHLPRLPGLVVPDAQRDLDGFQSKVIPVACRPDPRRVINAAGDILERIRV